MSEIIVLHCEETLDACLTAIYDAFVIKNKMNEEYTDSISISIGEGNSGVLFATEIEVKSDPVKAAKTLKAMQDKLGTRVYISCFYALCHYDEDRATIVLNFLVRAFKKGATVMDDLADYYVMRLMELSRKVSNESDKLKGFIRFRDIGNFLYGKVEPKCDIIPVVRYHFEDRYPGENFILVDTKRRYALVHPAFTPGYFVDEKLINLEELNSVSEIDGFENLWRRYFATMAIDERKNERCQNNLLPKWYRKNMLEFEAGTTPT